MRHQQVLPGLGAYARRVIRCVLAPAHGGSGLGLNFLRVDVGTCLGLHHEDGRVRLGDEVGDVLRLLGAELVVDLELSLRGLEPLRRVALQDDGEAPFGVRIELLQRVQTTGESTEEHLLDATGLGHGLPEVVGRLACRSGVVARPEFGETATDLHLVLRRLFPEVGHHLRVDFPCDQAAVTIEDADGFVLGQITAEVLHHLACEVVEEVGVGEVVDVIEVHQRVDDVVLRALLLESDLGGQGELLVGAQHLPDDLALAWLEMKLAHIQLEGVEARRDLASRYHRDARDVDGLLHHDLGGLRHHGGQVKCGD
ncbi:hypothetical protein PAERUG_E3_London_17_VIM_2_03_09_06322 [Pseudomonas aeruginosa]|nr:hypothetical protein PAERUG_E3_London_17_VIM_2_03_09_06322 [Pseudomonas aeruginosa]CRX19316.1 hypothetical protein PAERUG_P8_1_South_East_10_VIM_2_07_09_06281 [Pseudomonas aeruginosa]